MEPEPAVARQGVLRAVANNCGWLVLDHATLFAFRKSRTRIKSLVSLPRTSTNFRSLRDQSKKKIRFSLKSVKGFASPPLKGCRQTFETPCSVTTYESPLPSGVQRRPGHSGSTVEGRVKVATGAPPPIGTTRISPDVRSEERRVG